MLPFDVDIYLFAIIILDLLSIMIMIFKEQKRPSSIMVWSLLFIILPIAGFVLYIFIGKGPSLKKQRTFHLKMQTDKKLASSALDDNLNKFKNLNISKQHINDIVEFNAKYNLAAVAIYNDVTVYTDIAKQYEDMIADISNAKKSVNILYFIYKTDSIGTRLRDVLVQKAKEGVTIRLVVDDIGSMGAGDKFFKPLTDNGAEVLRFLQGKWKYLNFNINYRNHRKMVVIDDRIAYTGGANVGDEYMNKGKLPWRDTHMKVVGDGVYLINLRFFKDYSYVTHKDVIAYVLAKPKHNVTNILPMQLISSGPDVANEEIKQTYIKLIYNAKTRIWMQTPYYIPDESFADAVSTAVRSGVDVRIMIPEIPDKKLVYYATKSYASDMAKIGAKVYFYPAFIHSKTLIVDDDICSLGTFNIDVRSFKLHFELTNLMYGKEITSQMAGMFENDAQKSSIMDIEYINMQSKNEKFMQAIMRLFSPIF
ncbi:MAG: cardiolipin synthase [Endomicrobiaceae bacterium]|nr:cardiolipin synthase [Endomicrobiaceae bacterium]